MSRHRDIRNMNYEDALDDDALSDGGDDLTPEQEGLRDSSILGRVQAEMAQAQMNDGLEQIRLVIGPEESTGISDQSIKDALWEYYFDAEKTLEWALEEIQRRSIARERKDAWGEQELADDEPPQRVYLNEDDMRDYHDENTGPRLPSIFLAQQQPDFDNEAYFAVEESPQQIRRYLSTITERTERTEPSTLRQSRQPLSRDSRISMMTSSYGNEIGHRMSINSEYLYTEQHQSRQLDPNTSRNSPSLSAIEILSKFEPPPDNSSRSTLTPTNQLYPTIASEPAASFENLPTIPDLESKSSHRPRSKALPVTPDPSLPNKPQSKLSKLASSRGSSASSVSSRSSGTAVTGSIKTFPNLRPSAQSERPPSSVFSEESSKSLPPLPPRSSEPSFHSSTSLLVNQAIETALNLDKLDKDRASTPKVDRPPSIASYSERSKTPTQRDIKLGGEVPQSPKAETERPASPAKPLSKLAKLAQKKAGSTMSSAAHSGKSNYDLSSPITSIMSLEPRPLSKLAQLAQQKVDASRVPKLPKTTTEYLMPIANGPSVTTAITTSYQSLYSLTDPSKSSMIPKLEVVPLSAVSNSTSPASADAKPSKLAMKIKRASEKAPSAGFPSEPEVATPPLSPLFLPTDITGTRALPSAFASVLIDDPDYGGKDVDEKRMKHKERKKRDKDKDKAGSAADSHAHRSRKHKRSSSKAKSSEVSASAHQPFAFDSPSPDDIVLGARKGTSLGKKSSTTAAKDREKTLKQQAQTPKKGSTPITTPARGQPKKLPGGSAYASGATTPARRGLVDQQHLDLAGLNLNTKLADNTDIVDEPPPKMALAKEKILEEAQKALEGQSAKKAISIVVIGHVDAGKSTLMGRLLYELGRLDEKTKRANERGSENIGKSSFSWAWGLDGTNEERERGITMDIAQQTLTTPNRLITVLDAPGHKDFVPNMISGASQADSAVLVVDASTGEFEAGFQRAGQTREHLLLVRSLGVTQVIVAVNKLDQVTWSRARYEEIGGLMRPFLVQTGFAPSKTKFVPVGAMQGVNLTSRDTEAAADLNVWYKGPTLVEHLDALIPPAREILAPMRLPVSNVFKGQRTGVAVSGRICGGVLQVGEKLAILPGEGTTIVKSIEVEDGSVPWAASGTNVTLYLTAVDPIHLNIGSVLCSPNNLVAIATSFIARLIVFDIQIPITAGTAVEVFHHSKDVPATTVRLVSTIDRTSGKILKQNPRVLTKGASADVQIDLRTQVGTGLSSSRGIPLETFAVNKDMGRVLIRRGGETIAAGVVTEILG